MLAVVITASSLAHLIGTFPFNVFSFLKISLTQACAALVGGVQALQVGTFTGLQSMAFASTSVSLSLSRFRS